MQLIRIYSMDTEAPIAVSGWCTCYFDEESGDVYHKPSKEIFTMVPDQERSMKVLDPCVESFEFVPPEVVVQEVPTEVATPVRSTPKQKPPGVIAAIIEALRQPKTPDQILEFLVERFPDRAPEGMRKTITVQLKRIPKTKGIEIMELDNGKFVRADT